MDFFRSAAMRRIIYVIGFGLAIVRFAAHSHSQDQPVHLALPPPALATTTHS